MEWIKVILSSIGIVGMIIICAIMCLVIWLLGAATLFVLKWGSIVSILLIGATCIVKSVDRNEKSN